LLIGAVCFSACHKKSETASSIEKGRAAFASAGCNTCHRIGDSGGVIGPDLTYVGFRNTPEWLDRWIEDPQAWKARTKMPNPHLKKSTRDHIVDYLSTLKGEAYRQNPPWDAPEFASDPVKRGKELFKRVGCVGCHGNEGRGGFPNNNVAGGLVPSLTKAAEGFTKEELHKRIKDGSRPQKENPDLPEPMIYMPAWGQVLKDDEIGAVVEYLYSLKPATPASEAW
jgi:mono/diheme cytochrome c family protein